MASSNPCRGTSIAPAELQPSVLGSRANWSLIVVSPASCPPRMTALPSSSVVAPAPLVGRGRSGSRTQAELSKLKQSTRVVAGERPPATQTLAPKTKPETWLRGVGSGGRSDHALDPGSYTSAARTFPPAAIPPLASCPPPAAPLPRPPRPSPRLL